MNYFLWFFLFLSIPIIVHLFSFRRARKILFTNVRFIRKASTETRSKTRIKHWLILSARFLAFLSLIFVFVASIRDFNSTELDANDSFGLVYLDNSHSSVGNDVSDDIAFIERLILESESSKGYLLTNNFDPFSNHERSRSEIIDELPDISLSYSDRTFKEVLDRVEFSGDLYFVSDLQHSDGKSLERIKKDSLRNYYIFLKEQSSARNVYIDSIWVEKDIDDYQTNILRCKIGQTSNFSEGSIVVKLMDEFRNQISSVVVKLENRQDVSFSLPAVLSGTRFRLSLTGDDIEYDNDFFFVLGKIRYPKILVLSATYNKYLSNIFGNEQLFNLVISNYSDIDYKKISEADLVVMNDFYRIPEDIIRQNSENTSFIIIPSDSIDIDNYKRETGFSLKPSNSNFQEVQMNEGNLLLRGVYNRFKKLSDLPSAKRAFEVSGIQEVIFSLRDGGTYLGNSVGETIYLFSSPLSDEYTELPNHSVFLPLMYRIAEESLGSELSLFVYPGDFLEVPNLTADKPPRIISENYETIPEVTLRDRLSLIRIPVNLPPDFYYVIQGEDTIQSFGLNLAKSESQLEGSTFNELTNYFSDSPHVRIISASNGYEDISLPSTKTDSIWKYALILTLIFILVETMLHRYLK